MAVAGAGAQTQQVISDSQCHDEQDKDKDVLIRSNHVELLLQV